MTDGNPATPVPLRIDITHRDSERIVVAVVGDVDICNADRLEAVLTEAITTDRPRSVTIDFAGVPLLDAAGISALIRVRNRTHDHRGEFRLLNTAPLVTRVVDVLGLTDAFNVTPRA